MIDAGPDDLQPDGVAELGRDDRRELEAGDLPGLVADDAEGDLADLDGGEVELDRQDRLLVAGARPSPRYSPSIESSVIAVGLIVSGPADPGMTFFSSGSF